MYMYFQVDCLLDKRIGNGSQVEYLVRWKGFSAEWDTWEPAGNLENCAQKIKKFENNYKKKLENTQKIAKKLLSKSMARQDQSHARSMKTNFKNKKKDPKSVLLGKKVVQKSMGKRGNKSLDDVFGEVVNGTKSKDSIKKLPGKGNKSVPSANTNATPKSAGKTLVAKKIVSTAKKKQQTKKEAKSDRSFSAKKLAAPSKKGKTVKTADKVLKRKSDSDVLQSRKQSSKKKGLKTKSWTEVDEEVSFSSDDELINKTSAKHSPKDKKPKSAKKEGKTNIVKVKNESHNKSTKGLTSLKGKQKKVPSQTLNLSPKSAFRPVNKKKNQLRLSVSHLIGSKKKSFIQAKFDQDTCVGTDESKVMKNKQKLSEAKKRKLDTSNVEIETDMESDSDEEILYSLSDNSDLGINDTFSSNEKVLDEADIESSRSKSEGSMDKDQKTFQKGKKSGAKKSKSVSETSPEKAKKIKLLDSLKQTSTGKPGKIFFP